MTTDKIAQMLCFQLKKAGFVIQRYDASSTNSIYLKLDYGVCNSIRISDHAGKRHLKYRYNIGSFVKEFRRERDKYPRYYYRADRVQQLIKKIIEDKNDKVKQYGEANYQRFMEINKQENSGNSGFWRNAKIVN